MTVITADPTDAAGAPRRARTRRRAPIRPPGQLPPGQLPLGRPLLGRRRLRVALGLVWLLDAGLQAQPDLFGAAWWKDTLAQSVMGQPAALNHLILWAVGIVAAHAALWNSLFVAVQAAIGLALVTGRFERAAIMLSIPWALGIWCVGEGFGLLPTGFAMAATGAPGAVILYPMLGLLAWPGRRSGDAAPGRRRGRDGAAAIAARPAIAVWVTIWVGTALLALPWAFPVGQVVRANISEFGGSIPSWLGPLADPVQNFAAGHPVAFSSIVGVLQVLVGLGVLWRRTRRPAVIGALALCLLYGLCFQGLGGILTGFPSDATDPQAAPLLALFALAMWPAVTAQVRSDRGRALRSGAPSEVS